MNMLEERFMHELLQEAHHPTNIEPLLSRVQAQFSSEKTQPETQKVEVRPVGPRSPARRRWISAITTLVACLVLTLLVVLPGQSTATEILHEAVTSAEAPVDREYLIETTGRLKITGLLWVHGGDRFVLRLPALIPASDQYVWLGCNGSDFWIVPALGPVFVSRHADWLLNQLQRRHNVALPILHLSTVTRRLETRYTTPRLLSDASGMKHLVTEQKTPASELLPSRVDLYAQDHIIALLHLHWNARQPEERPFEMKLTLNQQTTMPGDWYEHTAHHAATRRVLSAEE